MKILVVGQGGREHVLVWKLAQSEQVTDVFCASGNAGTAVDGTNVDISSDDIERLVKFAETEGIGELIRDDEFLGAFKDTLPDAITGATISSVAMGKLINDSGQIVVPVVMKERATLEAGGS